MPVGKIDLTKPTISKTLVKRENTMATATIQAHDFSKKMNAEGSGPDRYAITDTPMVPSDSQWQKSNVVNATKPGRYYLWVKDLAGNIGDAVVMKVDDELTPDVDPDDKIIYDSGNMEDDTISKDKDSEDVLGYDDTPNTGDYNYLLMYIILMILSGFIIIVVNKRKISNI